VGSKGIIREGGGFCLIYLDRRYYSNRAVKHGRHAQ